MDHATLYLLLAAGFGLFMAWGIGANDVANAMATSVGSKALTLKRAILIAAVFEFFGAFLAGGQVTSTIRKGILDANLFSNSPEILIYGMLAALLAAAIWLLVATRYGLPVSTTHSIVGAIVGFAVVGVGIEAVHWNKVGAIAASWVVSPLLAGILSFLLFQSVRFIILDSNNPVKNAQRYVPIYIFFTGMIIALVTMFKGLKHIGLEMTPLECYSAAIVVGVLASLIGFALVKRLDSDITSKQKHNPVERVFAVLMIFTACAMAFAHGSNDVANAIGPVAAVVSIVNSGGIVGQKSPLAVWILLLGATGIVLGLVMYGRKVIKTVGSQITQLTPSRGFCCELAAATTVVLASGTGLPISTTHTLVGAIIGVGIVHGISSINLRMIGSIFMSWIITLPVGAVLAILFFNIFTNIF